MYFLFVIFFLVVANSANCSGPGCMDYETLEEYFKGNSENMEQVMEAFFPTDKPISQVVDVTYHIIKNLTVHSANDIEPPYKDLPVYLDRALRDVEETEEANHSTTLQFRWVASSITLLVGPELLEVLSLYAFHTAVTNLTLTIEVHPDCYIDKIDGCSNESEIIDLLYELTSNLFSYASSQGDSKNDLGYSALLYNKSNTTGQGYCLPHRLRHTFHRLHVTLGISFCLLAFFLSISTPAALVGIYGRLRDKMARPDSNWLYFVWATVIIVMVITPLMAFVNIYFIVEFAAALTVYSQTLFLVYIVLLASAIIFNFVTIGTGICCIYHGPESGIERFPIPSVFCFFCTCCQDTEDAKNATGQNKAADSDLAGTEGASKDLDRENERQLKADTGTHTDIRLAEDSPTVTREDADVDVKSKGDPEKGEGSDNNDSVYVGCTGKYGSKTRIVLVSLASYFFTVFLVLVSFHSVYIILGAVAAPVVVLSHASFYIAAFICLIMFMAFFLKFTNMSECEKLRKEPLTKKRCMNHAQYSLAVFSAFFLVPCVFGFGLFYYFFTNMVQDYRKDGDILSILGAFLPSAVVGFVGFCGNRLMKCVDKVSNKQ